MESNRSGSFVYYRWLILLLAAGLCLLPLWATAIGGFKTPGDLRTNAFGLPRQWLFDNHVSIATSGRFWQMLGNSAFIASVTVVLTLLVSSMAAFVLAHLHFAGKRWIANYLALGLTLTEGQKGRSRDRRVRVAGDTALTFPFATAVSPVFIRVRDMGLLDSYWGVILPQIAFNLGFAVVLLQGFFAELPNELFEAAFVDGCRYPRMFWQITLPLSRPILATVGVLSLVGSWNEYLLPLVMINNEALYPWPLGIMQYQGQYGPVPELQLDS